MQPNTLPQEQTPFNPRLDPDFVSRAETILWSVQRRENIHRKYFLSQNIGAFLSICKYAYGYSFKNSFIYDFGPAKSPRGSHSTLNILLTASIAVGVVLYLNHIINRSRAASVAFVTTETRALFETEHPLKNEAIYKLAILENYEQTLGQTNSLFRYTRLGSIFANTRTALALFPANEIAATYALMALEAISERLEDVQDRPRIKL